MVEKRKRYVAVRESTQVKRRSTSPALVTTTPEVPPRSLPPDVPTSFAKDGPLPVVPNRQGEGLLLKDYKSVAESKVMTESLIRSQRKWVDGGIFEKFWTKPLKSRKLDPIELEKNPSRDCMTKIGNCTLSCKPHKFEIRLFGVSEPAKAPPVQLPLQAQSQSPAPSTSMAMTPRPQYGNTLQHPHPNSGAHTTPAHQPATLYVPPQQLPPPQTPAMPSSQVQGPPRQLPPPEFTTPAPPSNAPPPNFIVPGQSPNPHIQQIYHQQSDNQHMGQLMPAQNMVQQASPRPDPVIQSLAVRAASDPELKALMRIVASGQATTEQLKIFQGHIDALTPATSPPIAPTVGGPRPLAPSQGSTGAPVPARQAAPQQMHLQHLQHLQHQQHQQHLHHQHQQPQYLRHQQHQQHQQHLQHQHPHLQYAPHPQYSQQQQPQLIPHRPAQYSQPQPQIVHSPAKPRPFPQPPKQEITSVVFEFVDSYSQGDRFIFPKYTILEYVKNGTMVKASFIVTRKPVDDLDEYYQPITIILESMSPRTLEILQKVVADQETTCKHMKHLMETRKRAGDSFLVFRLRRDPSEVVPNRPEVQERIELPPQKAIRVRRDTSTPTRDSKGSADHPPHPVPPSRPRVKTVKKALPKEQPQIVIPITNNEPSSTVPITPIPRTPRQPKPPRSRKGRIADPTKSCNLCNTSKTSLWRKADINGENVTVCNACGIKWKTGTQRAAQVATMHAMGLPPRMGSRENSNLGDVRSTSEQLLSGGPQMQFHPFAQGFAALQSGGEQPEYPTTMGATQVGQVYQQPFLRYQEQEGALQHQKQQISSQQDSNTQQTQYPQNAETVSRLSTPDKQKESQLSAASLIVASHVAAHQPQHPASPAPTSQGPSEGMTSAGS